MVTKETTRSTPGTENLTTTTVTNAQLQAMIDQGVTAALVARDANRNDDDSHTSGTGTEGVVELTQWFERMETVFRISNCTMENQVKFATCTLLGIYLTWWNSHARTVSHDVAYAMTWTELKKKMTDKYCPRGEMKKLEAELWNLKVKGTDVLDYNKRFQELASLWVRMFPEESNKIERYVGGLPDMIHESVVASKPKTMQDAMEMATELMDKKISTFAERRAENKRKLDNNNQAQQQFPKRQNVAQAYTIRTGKRKEYAGTLPLCNKCKNQGHYMSDCPELKNQNHGNQAGGTGTHRMVLAIVGGETGQDPNNIKDEIQSYINVRRKPLKLQVNNRVMLKVSPCKEVVHFGKRGKLNPRYVGPSKVMEKVGSVAYKLELPQELSRIHNMFYVSNLKKCYANKPLAVPLDGLHFDDKLQFVKEPIEILDQEVKWLRQSRVPIVKI
ncbi:reverse transcriptase domain-containing protein [Tanacetum coccineum]